MSELLSIDNEVNVQEYPAESIDIRNLEHEIKLSISIGDVCHVSSREYVSIIGIRSKESVHTRPGLFDQGWDIIQRCISIRSRS